MPNEISGLPRTKYDVGEYFILVVHILWIATVVVFGFSLVETEGLSLRILGRYFCYAALAIPMPFAIIIMHTRHFKLVTQASRKVLLVYLAIVGAIILGAHFL